MLIYPPLLGPIEWARGSTPDDEYSAPEAETAALVRAQVRYIENYSLVRLRDGRMGVLTKHVPRGRKPMVKLTPELGVEVAPGEVLDILMHPAELAFHFLTCVGRPPLPEADEVSASMTQESGRCTST